MSFEAFDTKERIRQATNIVELIGESNQLRRQGRNYVTLCPWHKDSNPSLQINPDRQSWKCWVCDDGGDVFSYVMKQEQVDFREALQMLADRAGIVLSTNSASPVQPGSVDDKKTLYKAMAWATDQYHRCLLESEQAAPAREYIEQRGLTPESVQRYRIGYSPDSWQWILDRSRSTEFSPTVLEAIGLVVKKEDTGRQYDRFRGRVLFPICDPQKRPIGVGGRILPEFDNGRAAKYFNPPTTRLYSKSDQLYGLDVARDNDGVKKDRTIVVMEGYTDVVMSAQFGVDNAVAVCGTSLTDGHLKLMRRFADRVVLLLDGDEAGQSKANPVLEMFIASEVDLRIVTLPDGLDPCDFVVQHGGDALRSVIDNAPDALEHKIRVQTGGVDLLRDTHRANMVLQDLLATIAKAPRALESASSHTRLREQQVLNRLAREFHVSEQELQSQLQILRKKSRTKPLRVSSEVSAKPERLELAPFERDLFELMLQQPEALSSVLENVAFETLETEIAKTLLAKYAELEAAGIEADFDRLMIEFDDPAMKNLLVNLDEQCHKKSQYDRELALRDLLNHFRRRNIDLELRQQEADIASKRLSEEQETEALRDLFHKLSERAR